MKVLVTGATGLIGFGVAQAFRRAGHEVLGLCRSEEKARVLAREEIHPVLGDIGKPETYEAHAEASAVLIHAAADLAGGMVDPDRTVVDAFRRVAGRGARPKTILYTSGVWVLGETGATATDETAPVNPAKLVAWRPAHEQLVLEAPGGARGLVLRPGCVYGKRGGMTGAWFQGARAKALSIVGPGRNRWAMVHVDDLAEAYLRAAESGLTGEVFNVTDRSRDTVEEMVSAAARAAGYDGGIAHVAIEDARRTMGDFADCLALDQHVDSRKAVRLLGWQPRHGGFVNGADAYFRAWKAHQTP